MTCSVVWNVYVVCTCAFGCVVIVCLFFFFFQAEDGIRDLIVTGVQTCALPISNTLLSISPKSGIVASGSSVPITVTPNVLNSTAGVINATLAIQGTSVKSQQEIGRAHV